MSVVKDKGIMEEKAKQREDHTCDELVEEILEGAARMEEINI